jgi:hypothetical protein
LLFNIRLPEQGELDIVGAASGAHGAEVWLAEVAIHLDGLNYGGGTNAQTVHNVAQKVAAARAYAAQVYQDITPTVELWSPVVSARLVAALSNVEVDLIVNGDFTARVSSPT